MTITYYNQKTVLEKRKIREQLNKIKEHSKRQIDLMTELWIKPEQHRLKLIDDVLKNKISLEHYLKRNKYISEYLKEALKGKTTGE